MENKSTIIKFKKLTFDVPDILEDSITKIVKEFIKCIGFKKTESEKEKKVLEQNKISEEYKKLINMYFKLPDLSDDIFIVELATATEIRDHICKKKGKYLSPWKIGQELKALGFKQKVLKVSGKTQRLYRVIPINPEDVVE